VSMRNWNDFCLRLRKCSRLNGAWGVKNKTILTFIFYVCFRNEPSLGSRSVPGVNPTLLCRSCSNIPRYNCHITFNQNQCLRQAHSFWTLLDLTWCNTTWPKLIWKKNLYKTLENITQLLSYLFQAQLL
jgi:hypothetical protein